MSGGLTISGSSSIDPANLTSNLTVEGSTSLKNVQSERCIHLYSNMIVNKGVTLRESLTMVLG